MEPSVVTGEGGLKNILLLSECYGKPLIFTSSLNKVRLKIIRAFSPPFCFSRDGPDITSPTFVCKMVPGLFVQNKNEEKESVDFADRKARGGENARVMKNPAR